MLLLNANFFLGLYSDPEGEATWYSETSVGFQRITRCYIPEVTILKIIALL
jgi:hypothetical protein